MRSALTIEKHHIEIDAERIVVTTLDGLSLSATPNTTHSLFSFVGNPLTTTKTFVLALTDGSLPSHPYRRDETETSDVYEQPLQSVALVVQSAIHRALLWHTRLGHPNPQTIRLLRRYNKVYDFPITKACIEAHLTCDACQRAKSKRLGFSLNCLPRATRPGESWHSDIWGPFPHPSVGNFRYFVTFTDDYSTLKPQHPTVFQPFASARSRNPTFIPLSTTSSLPLEVPQPSLSPSSAPHVPVPLTTDVRLPQRPVFILSTVYTVSTVNDHSISS